MRRISVNHFIMFLLLILVTLAYSRLTYAEYKYYSKGKRDPFIPLVSGKMKIASLGLESVETIDDVKLEGIMFDPQGESIAVLNGEVVKEGERAVNIEIVEIRDMSVTLKIYNRLYTVNLIEEGGETVEE